MLKIGMLRTLRERRVEGAIRKNALTEASSGHHCVIVLGRSQINLLEPLIKIMFLLVPYGYIIIRIKKEFLRR